MRRVSSIILAFLPLLVVYATAFRPSIVKQTRPHFRQWSLVEDKPEIEVMDVEDEAAVTSQDLPETIIPKEILASTNEKDKKSWAQGSLFDFASGTNDFDVSSRTLKSLQALQDEGRSILAKAQQEAKAFGAYATSKALADSQLLWSVTVVVASELAQILARPLLPSSSSSSSSSSGGFSSASANGTAVLTLKEKVEMVQLGLWPVDKSASFILPSFSNAGDQEALLADMYVKSREARGVNALLPRLPKNLALLRAPLKAISEIPKLPLNALKAADAAHRLNRAAIGRRPTQQLLEAVGSPILGTYSEARKRLKGKNRISYSAPILPGVAEDLRRRSKIRGQRNNEEDEEVDVSIGMMPRGGADGVWGVRTKNGRRGSGDVATRGAAAGTAFIEGADGMFWNEEEVEDEEEADVQFRTVRRMKKRGQYTLDDEEENDGITVMYAGGLGTGEMDDSILEAKVEEMALEDDEKPGLRGLVFKGVLRVLDLTFLGLEYVVVEAVPAVVKRTKVAARRVNDAIKGETGQDGWDLLPVFEKPMRSQIMSTRR